MSINDQEHTGELACFFVNCTDGNVHEVAPNLWACDQHEEMVRFLKQRSLPVISVEEFYRRIKDGNLVFPTHNVKRMLNQAIMTADDAAGVGTTEIAILEAVNNLRHAAAELERSLLEHKYGLERR